jgi:Divergent InlB B-repeat domain
LAGSIVTKLAAAAVLLLLIGAGGPSSAAGQTTTDEATTEATLMTLAVDVTGEGQVTSSPSGIQCPPTCSAPFAEGTPVTLTASAADGFAFAGWSGACTSDEASCSITVSGDAGVEAAFTQQTPTDSEPPPPPPPPPSEPPPSPPPGATPPPGPGALFEEVDRMIRRLEVGSIAFNVPETLAVGDTEQVQLLLSAQQPISRLKEQLTELGDREGARIRVSDQMEARLTGQKFKIEAVTPELQVVSGEGVTEWKWDIEPTEAGTLDLHLTLTAIIQVRGADRAFRVDTFDRTLEVRVPFLSQLSSFVKANWQWLWTAILIPVVGWVLARRRRRAVPDSGPKPAGPSEGSG